MKMHLSTSGGGNLIKSCDAAGFTIGETLHRKSIVVTTSDVADWPVQSFDDVNDATLDRLLEWSPELVLVGTGGQQRFAPLAQTAKFVDRGIGIEFMTSAAACRTFNIVAMEGRQVLAALLLPHSNTVGV